MKKTMTVVSTLLLAACGSSGSDSGGEKDSYQLSMGMQAINLCGQVSQYSNYEVIAYGDDGEIISRTLPNNSGQVEAAFEQSHVNLLIVRDGGADIADKKDLDITVLAQYPVGNLGTLSVKSESTTGCQCQTATIGVSPGDLTSYKLNLPYSGFSISSATSLFNNTQICKVAEEGDALLVANHLDDDSGFIYYRTIENASDFIVDGQIPVPVTLVGHVGRGVTVNTSDDASHWIKYVTDETYNYSVPDKNDDSINVLDHDRVEKIEFKAEKQLNLGGTSEPIQLWGVNIPMLDNTTDITYSQPDFEPELLSPLLNNPSVAYNVQGDNPRVIGSLLIFSRPDGTSDIWNYILPSKSDIGFSFELPTDYLDGLPEGTSYNELKSYSDWELYEIPSISSLDELYQSDWLKVLKPSLSKTWIRPPATYSYVSLEQE